MVKSPTHEVDIFDREKRFIDQVLSPLRAKLPELKIVLEHITTQQASSLSPLKTNGLPQPSPRIICFSTEMTCLPAESGRIFIAYQY